MLDTCMWSKTFYIGKTNYQIFIYICSLHFIDPIEENHDPIIATSTTERNCRKRKPAGRTSETFVKCCNNEDELITDDIVCAIDNLKKRLYQC